MGERVNPFSFVRRTVCQVTKVKVKGLGLNISYLALFFIFFHGAMKKFNQLAKKNIYT